MSGKFTSLDEQLKKCKNIEDLMGKDGLIKNMIKGTIERILQAELDDYLGYKKHESKGRNSGDSRNGFSRKKVRSSLGEIELDIPRDRNGKFKPTLLPKHKTEINSFDEKIISMYAKGMTTRDIQDHVLDIYGAEISPSMVSMITDKVVSLVTKWQQRKLKPVYAIVYVDALYYSVRENSAIVKKAAYQCIGIGVDGIKEILGLWVGHAEAAGFWKSVFLDLQKRGVQKILIACMDGLVGLPEACNQVFPETKIQLCVVHMIRNSLKYIARKDKKKFIIDLKKVYTAKDEPTAREELDKLKNEWQEKYPDAIHSWLTHWKNLAGYFSYPEALRRTVYTTNSLESLNRQYRKVTKNRSIFPTDGSLIKLLFLAGRDIQKKWNRVIKNWQQIEQDLKIVFGAKMVTV